ncbi:MAG: GerMN domain-containing protein [Clostridia bacterium]|nr:GerMN domain-containing protein [Clostridia bacterium]
MKKFSVLLKKILYNSKHVSALVFALCFVFLAASCSVFSGIEANPDGADNTLPLDPRDGIGYISSANLYYRFSDTDFLIPYSADIEFTSNERPEYAILRELLSRTHSDSVYTTAIPREVEVVDMAESGNVLFVTLNAAFLNDELYSGRDERRIAVCQIVNTLTEYRNTPVQILIDRSENSMGERVSYTDLGFESQYDLSTDYAAPFTFTKSIVTTPEVILKHSVECLKAGYYDKAAHFFVSNTKKRNITADDLMKFNSLCTVQSLEVISVDTGFNSADVLCKIITVNADSEEYVFEGKITMSAFDSLYKVVYESFMDCAGGVG